MHLVSTLSSIPIWQIRRWIESNKKLTIYPLLKHWSGDFFPGTNTYIASLASLTSFSNILATCLSNTLSLFQCNTVSSLFLLLLTSPFRATVTDILQYFSGVKVCIWSWREMQNESVGIWQGPYDITSESRFPYFPWKNRILWMHNQSITKKRKIKRSKIVLIELAISQWPRAM
jgi:hypothetical protein